MRHGLPGPHETPPHDARQTPPQTTTSAPPSGGPRRPSPRHVAVALGAAVGAGALATLVVVGARWSLELEPVQQFLVDYPGTSGGKVDLSDGLSPWVGWQHFLNALFLVLIVKTGWQIRTQTRPPALWTRRRRPDARESRLQKVNVTVLAHLALDVLWLTNGIVFVALLVASGEWVRLVPTTLEVFPNAASAALQYATLEWPVHRDWGYNSLQQIAYFAVVFVAAPLAVLTGVRMSPLWSRRRRMFDELLPLGAVRRLHFATMLFFVAFTLVHVVLVLTSGVRRNLNHMYASTGGDGWLGLVVFGASIAVTVAAFLAVRPAVVTAIAARAGHISR